MIEAALLALLAPAVPVAPAASADTVAYTLAPVMAGGTLSGLSVEIELTGDADGETRLLLPGEWAGSGELWRHVADVEVENAASVREDGPGARVLTHAPGAPLTVRYRVVSAYDGDPGFRYEKARPLILPGWFFFHGEGVFATPERAQDTPARFTWRGFPPEWKLASDLDHLSGERPGTVRDVVESVAIGAPDLTVVHRETDGAPLRIAVRGSWGFTPEAFADAVERVIVAANHLWGDRARPFFVPLAPLGGTGPGLSYTGTGRSDAFSVASTPGFELGSATRFIAHEYLHTWLPGELGGPFERDEPLGYWFSEGFTDFLAARTLLSAGLWSFTDYVDELNRTLVRYAVSPARGASGADVVQRFWTDRDVQQLPYDRGHLLAHLLDHRIRQATNGATGLPDVLRAQRTRALRHRAEGRRVPAATLFADVLREEIGLDVGADLARYVERGGVVLLPAELLGGCATVVTATQPGFSRGFDLEATRRAGGVLTGVDPAGPAYAAGMRDGMRVVRREAGTTGDSSVETAYRVRDGEEERVIRYMPAGAGRVTLQRVRPAPAPFPAECAGRG